MRGRRQTATPLPAGEHTVSQHGSEHVEHNVVERSRAARDRNQLDKFNRGREEEAGHRSVADSDATTVQSGAQGHEEENVARHLEYGMEEIGPIRLPRRMSDVAERHKLDLVWAFLREQREGEDQCER